MSSGSAVLIFAISALSHTGAIANSTGTSTVFTTVGYWHTYSFLGNSANCHESVYVEAGSSVKINAWPSSASGYLDTNLVGYSGFGSTCPIYLETYAYSPENPRFKFIFSKADYINDCGVKLNIHDSRSTLDSPIYSYSCGSDLPTLSEHTVYTKQFTVTLDRSSSTNREDLYFSLIVSLEYDSETDAPYTLNWNLFVWPIIGCAVFVSFVAVLRSSCCRQANASARNVRSATNISPPDTTQPSSTAPPRYEPATQLYPYPGQPEAHPMPPYPPPSADAETPPPKYEDVAPYYPIDHSNNIS